ncbi:hypothetical protein BDW74DRAFT_89437 [Aspergillus multicolor]|uniref:uncharacterized protein n=1 Tax=Aspergillus multicolor TaxID=41759 RepID=UPI003CCD523A
MRPTSRSTFAIAIICALPLEADAVEALFDETYDRLGKHYGKQQGDANAYINGRMGKHDVVLCYMPGMGKGSAASVASSLQMSYTGVRLALVVGICGCAPPPPDYQEIFLGDVIISDSVIEYDFGRQYPGGLQRKTGFKDTLGRPGREIRALLNGLRAEKSREELQEQAQRHFYVLQQGAAKWTRPRVNDVLFKASYPHKHHNRASPATCSCSEDAPDKICEEALGKDCDDLGCDKGQYIRCRESLEAMSTSIHIGPVASADVVMKSGQHRDEIVRKENVIAFEMEGAGVWDNIPCIIVKGVCDYADSHKSKLWQSYAAATGASVAKALLEYWMPAPHKDPSRNHHLIIPFVRNPHFVGRQAEIRKLESLISMPGGPRKLAITGLGGIGKTQIALELAYRMRDREPECSIFWIPCTSYEAIEQAYWTIAQLVGTPSVKPAEAKEYLRAYLSRSDEKWLLIFDNADDMEMWTKGSNHAPPFMDIPFNNQGHAIFTTRNRELAVDLVSSDVIHIREFDDKSGVEFLVKSLRKELLQDTWAITALLEQLTFLPLAISQATAYINKKGISVSDYLMLLNEQETDVMELLSKDFADHQRYNNDMQNPVAKTWLISFSQIQKLDQLAVEYLSLMACVDPRDIPQSFLPQPGSKLQMVDALGLLSAYSLVDIQLENGNINLHRLVRLATRNWMKKEQQFSLYVRKAADRFNEIFPNKRPANRQLWRKYLPHTISLIRETEFGKQQEGYINLLQKVGQCLILDGRYDDAEVFFSVILEILLREAGDKHPYTLSAMSDLAMTYWHQGQWNEAEELLIQVPETQKQVLELQHPKTLNTMSLLTFIYRDRGQWREAEELGRQTLENQKQVLGLSHPDTLSSMALLALTYTQQGQWKKAEELGAEALQIQTRVLGPNHPSTLGTMTILGLTDYKKGNWQEAEKLGLQVIEIQKQVLGPNHPDTLTSMSNLAINTQIKDGGRKQKSCRCRLWRT